MGIALITGASKGIGRSIAFELASKGYGLVLVARDAVLLHEVSEDIKGRFAVPVLWLPVDLSEPDAATRILARCEREGLRVNMLVNNAGFGLSGDLREHPWEEYDSMIRVNMTALTALCVAFLPMLESGSRSFIMNIASTAAYQAVPGLSVYAATKAYVLSFSRALSHELAGSSVTVTCVSPGATDTDWARRAQIRGAALKAAERMNMSPEQVARIAVQATLKGRVEVVTGFTNRLTAFIVKFIPASWVEKIAYRLYK
jgi:uncharacterized protein